MRKRKFTKKSVIDTLESRTLLSAGSATLSISSSNLSPTVVESITITARVTPAIPGGAVPTGSVTILDNGTVIGLALLLPDGTGTTSAQLPLGNQSITATYAGDSNYATADSVAPIVETVRSVPKSLDTSFGNAGILTGFEVLGIQFDGHLIATRPDGPPVLLNPNGSYASDYTGVVPTPLNSAQGGTPLPPPLAVDGGKHLVLTSGTLTRYNSDGSLDTTFGVGGSVSDFVSGTSATAFKAYTMVPIGTDVLVVGEATLPLPSVTGVAVAAIDSSGNRITSFGSNGLALESNAATDQFLYGQINLAQIGPDGKLYVGADQGDDPYLYRFDTTAGNNDAQTIFQSHTEGPNLAGLNFQPDGKILALIHDGGVSLNLVRLNSDFTADTSFGTQGEIKILSPFGVQEPDHAQADSLLVRGDGTILVSGVFHDISRPAPDSYFTFAYLSHTAALTLSSASHFPIAGDSVNLIAHVEPYSLTGPVPTGSVTFFSDGASIGSADVQPDGTATLATTALPVGIHTITDTYGGDTNYGPATWAPPIWITVSPATQAVPPPDPFATSLALSSSNIDATVGDSVLLTAQIAPAGWDGHPMPSIGGTINFFSDGVAIGSAPLQAGGTATLATASLPEGAHAITAIYAGDSIYYLPTQSAPLTENVAPVSNVQAAASERLPAKLITGTKAHISSKIEITTTGAFTLVGKLRFAWFLSTGTTIDSNAIALSSGLSKKLRVAPHKHATLTANLKTIPTSVAAGAYHLLLQVTDPNGGMSVVPSARTIAVAAPTIDLSGKFLLRAPTNAKAGAKTSETLVVNNTGNSPADGVLHFLFDATTGGALGPSVVQRSAHISIKPGKSMTIHLNKLIMPATAGSYFLVAQLDPAGAFHDVNLSNNLVVSSAPVVVR